MDDINKDPDDLGEFLEHVRKKNCSFADKYSMVGERWIDEDNAARLLEDTKSVDLEERKNALIRKRLQQNEKLADNAAEREVKAMPEWRERVESEVKARTRANKLKLVLKVLDMRHSEQQSLEATKRAEMKL
jgi:hypothetical protein